MNPTPRRHLPRLHPGAYEGHTIVHWTLTIAHRATGWLDEVFHDSFRFLLLHSLARQDMACALYCLMPDHVHLLTMGLRSGSNQRLFMRQLRLHTGALLKARGFAWQKQCHDHVLRNEERDRHAFEEVAGYISYNPVRAGLANAPDLWPFPDALFPGYPELRFRLRDYWHRFWCITAAKRSQQ